MSGYYETDGTPTPTSNENALSENLEALLKETKKELEEEKEENAILLNEINGLTGEITHLQESYRTLTDEKENLFLR